MKNEHLWKVLILSLLLSCIFVLPVSAEGPSEGRLLFQFRFMGMEETDYRMDFLREQLEYFGFEEDKQLNETLITQLLMLVDSRFEWETDKIGFGISDVDFSGDLDDICAAIFPEDHQRSYICQMVDEYNWQIFFQYLSTLQVTHSGYEHLLFLGDSRFVGIRDYTGYDERCSFICEIGTGYSWFTGTAYQELLSYADSLGEACDRTALIINLGVNDLVGSGPFDGLASQYAAFVNEYIVPLGFDVYYMSVNPVEDALCSGAGYTITNDKIMNFNENLRAYLSAEVTWIDTYSWFQSNGLGFSSDGLHYTGDTNQAIVNEITWVLS